MTVTAPLVDIHKGDHKDSILQKPTVPYVFDPDNPLVDPVSFAKKLGETMIAEGGVGLAAPQIGFNYSVFVIGDPTNKDSIMAMFNPIIVDYSEEQVYYDEGCLSYPGLYMKVKRPAEIRIRFTDMHGETTTTKYKGFTARVIQHEYDHLQGTTFTSRASKTHKDQGMRKLKKFQRKHK